MSERFSAFNLNATPEQPTSHKYFDPEKDVSEEMWVKIRAEEQDCIWKREWNYAAALASFQFAAGRRPLLLVSDYWNRFDEHLLRAEQQELWFDYSELLSCKLLAGLNVDQGAVPWEKIAAQRETSEGWIDFCILALPELLAGRSVSITDQEWDEIRNYREAARTNPYPEPFAVFSTLEMLRDATIERDAEGKITRIVRPTNPPDFTDEKPPLPQTRSF